MSALPVSALYAGLLGLWLMYLTWEVSRRRRRHDVSLGSGGVPELERGIRAHGNAAETVPLGLILLMLAEGMGAPHWGLHLAGAMLVVGRVMHGVHFLAGHRRLAFRFWGMVLTIVPIIFLALGLIGHALVLLPETA